MVNGPNPPSPTLAVPLSLKHTLFPKGAVPVVTFQQARPFPANFSLVNSTLAAAASVFSPEASAFFSPQETNTVAVKRARIASDFFMV